MSQVHASPQPEFGHTGVKGTKDPTVAEPLVFTRASGGTLPRSSLVVHPVGLNLVVPIWKLHCDAEDVGESVVREDVDDVGERRELSRHFVLEERTQLTARPDALSGQA